MATFSAFSSNPTFSGMTKTGYVTSNKNNTDVVAPNVELYIEGVQVPFESISVNQAYLEFPTADIQVPPESGLLDITRGYEPKVHIFYQDDNYGGMRLLFWGHIKSNSYSRSRSSGSTSITFHCVHKNALLNQVSLDYSGWATGNTESITNPGISSAAKVNSMNSASMVIEALSGIDGVADETTRLSVNNTSIDTAPTNKLDPSLTKLLPRLGGMTGSTINLWNQIKKAAYSTAITNLGLRAIYVPLVEEGLGFFKRMSGHPILEDKLQGDKKPYCHKEGMPESKVLIPPYFKSAIASAAQSTFTAQNLNNIIGFSGELTSYIKLTSDFLGYCKYDIMTLASPAEISLDPKNYVDDVNVASIEKVTVETIVKPQTPFYFSPTCNVLLPRMYSSIQINQDEGNVPTRVAALHDAHAQAGTSGGVNITFIGPPSIREAISYNAMLKNGSPNGNLSIKDSLSYSYFIPGKYEQGTGIKPSRVVMPWWLSVVISDEKAKGSAGGEDKPAQGTPDYNDLMVLSTEWKSRYSTKIQQQDSQVIVTYDPRKNNLNPFDPLNGDVKPYERLMFSSIDYEFSERVAGSRNGFVECIFNPYIIPGYPMDIIDENPNHPSFHAYCTSVVHTITSRSIGTTVAMAAVTTYAELSNYYTPPLPAYLQSSLNIVNAVISEDTYANTPVGDSSAFKNTASTLIQNPTAKATADVFYRQVLGVGAAAPDDLLHFSSGRAYPLTRISGVLVPRVLPGTSNAPNISKKGHYARELDDYYSSVGNLRLVGRPIESLDSIASKFQYNFIRYSKVLYNNSFVNYVNPIMASNLLLEPGASLFLDYMEVDEFIQATLKK